PAPARPETPAPDGPAEIADEIDKAVAKAVVGQQQRPLARTRLARPAQLVVAREAEDGVAVASNVAGVDEQALDAVPDVIDHAWAARRNHRLAESQRLHDRGLAVRRAGISEGHDDEEGARHPGEEV